MRFYIQSDGDNSVGLDGFSCHVTMPNAVGMDDGEWKEYCHNLLHELYGAEQQIKIYDAVSIIDMPTLIDLYRYYYNNYLTIEKFNNIEMPYLTNRECRNLIQICRRLERNE